MSASMASHSIDCSKGRYYHEYFIMVQLYCLVSDSPKNIKSFVTTSDEIRCGAGVVSNILKIFRRDEFLTIN